MSTQPSAADPRSGRLLEVIHTQAEIARLGLDLGGVMAFVAGRAQALTGASGAVIELAEGEEMVYRAASGQAATHLGLRLKRRTSLSGRCVEAGTALRCDDAEADARVDREATRRIGVRSMICVPLRHDATVVGVLKVVSDRAHAFDDEAQEILELMSSLVASAMFHATRHESGDLYHRATHDALTDLPNRALFFERLRLCLDLAGRHAGGVAVVMIDMDDLKPINDRHGHRAGDAALKEMAMRIRACSRATDTVARLGGDEFAAILPGIDHHDGLRAHCRRLREGISRPFPFEGHSLPIGASVGAALFPTDGKDFAKLLDLADHAMYADKRAKRGERPVVA
jgi:diguanylate cyclase (GGDEF)-like protein